MKKSGKILASLIAAALILGTGSAAAYAGGTAYSEPASSLAVYLTADGRTELVHDYTIAEITGLADGKSIKYSSIDAMPARVLTVGTGVYLGTLVSDLKKYTDTDIASFEKMKLTATDGWSRTLTKDALNKKQYYYGGLFNTSTWDPTVGKAGAAAAEGAVEVKPMLAVMSWQSRVMNNTSDISSMIGELTGETMFRLCFGMSSADLSSGVSTTSEYGRWIDKIEIVMGDSNQDASAQKPSAVWKNSFQDVREKDWYYDAVGFACSNGLFQGTGLETFSPGGKMTRGMFVTVLGRMAKADTLEYTNSFTDVVKGQYYERYAAWASSNGIVSGYEGRFRPDDLVTREQIALILYRYAKLTGRNVSDTSSARCTSYSDYDSAAGSAKEALCWAVNSGVMTGGDGKLQPKAEATRAQVAAVLKNYSESVNK